MLGARRTVVYCDPLAPVPNAISWRSLHGSSSGSELLHQVSNAFGTVRNQPSDQTSSPGFGRPRQRWNRNRDRDQQIVFCSSDRLYFQMSLRNAHAYAKPRVGLFCAKHDRRPLVSVRLWRLAEVRRGWAILSYFEPRREGKFCVCKDPL